MKNQYVGDASDYLKYALLRALQGPRTGGMYVCWMLTEDDSGPDGKKLGYLGQPALYRQVDPPLFDSLAQLVAKQRRTVIDVAKAEILPRAGFHDGLLPDAKSERAEYFDEFFQQLGPKALVFFDPDNGLEIASKKLGAKDSSKFVFWTEIEDAAPDRSLLIFQHWNHVEKRDAMVARLFEEVARRLPDHQAFALRGPNVLFLAAARPEEANALITAAREVAEKWPRPLSVQTPETSSAS